jgi:competence protein ComEC
MTASYTDVHVLNVGAGSCTVVVPPSGHVSMIDVNDGSDQRSYETSPSEAALIDPIEWCTANLGTSLFRFILSHPDADHMAGLRHILLEDTLQVQNFWDLPHSRTRDDDDFQNDEAKLDWLTYVAMRQGASLEGISWPKVINPLRGDSLDFWKDDNFSILSPSQELVDAADQADKYNDASYVLRFRHDGSSVLLASDVEEPAWQDMIAADKLAHMRVLIASHHGRKSGFSGDAMDLIRPEVVIVSTAALPPDHDAIDDYKSYTSNVFSTRIDGNIRVRMHDGGLVEVTDADGILLATA